jgi:hypothetical protein
MFCRPWALLEQFLAGMRCVLDEVDSDVIEKMAHTFAAVSRTGVNRRAGTAKNRTILERQQNGYLKIFSLA